MPAILNKLCKFENKERIVFSKISLMEICFKKKRRGYPPALLPPCLVSENICSLDISKEEFLSVKVIL